jgi:hypothetical protein
MVFVGVAVFALAVTSWAGAETTGRELEVVEQPFPVGETLGYAVSWMGIRCGHMDITSFTETDADGRTIYRITLHAQTTKFFDGIYKVRSRLDSFVDPVRMASFRYEEHAVEKKKRKDDVWVIDPDGGGALRDKNGEISKIPADAEHPFDPLAFVYRLRTIDAAVGEEASLFLMTDKGAVETIAKVTRAKQIKTKRGKCDAVAVVPAPRDGMMFSKSGAMVIWLEKDDPARLCRIEFDLSFGKLVASLQSVEKADRPPLKGEEWMQ